MGALPGRTPPSAGIGPGLSDLGVTLGDMYDGQIVNGSGLSPVNGEPTAAASVLCCAVLCCAVLCAA